MSAPRVPAVPDAPAALAWCLCLLGVPCLQAEPAGPRLPLSPKDAALLAVVALDGPIAPDHASALIWPNVDAKKADTSLRQRLFRLRREAGTHLIASGSLLQFAPGVRTDLQATLVQIASDPNAGQGQLLGDLGFDDQAELADWVKRARMRWREQCERVLAATAAQCEARHEIVQGLAYALRLVQSDPLSEHAQRRLMRLHYLRGDGSAAIAAFERFEALLKNELGARPSAETIELLNTIERGATRLPAQRAIVPASLIRPPRLIGRTAEFAALARAWAGQRAFALLGEAGIGKTRLLHEFAADQAGVVSVQARPGDAGIACAVLARLLRAVLAAHPMALAEPQRLALALLLPELGQAAALSGEAQRLLLHQAMSSVLADATAQGLRALIVDDLHFADDASIEFMQSLTQSEALTALKWGFAQRPIDASPAAAALRATLEEAQRLESVPLGPLNPAQMVALIDSLGLPQIDAQRLAPALMKHTGGNPLFALETLKDMLLTGLAGHADFARQTELAGPVVPAIPAIPASQASHGGQGGRLIAGLAPGPAQRLPQPTTVGALVLRRLAQLSAPALRLARTAALAGESFSAELAAAVLEAHPLDIAEPWRELESAQVIRDGAFAHDLVCEATRASVPAPIAQLLHRRIAAHLLAHGAAAAAIAPHWAGALDWAQAGAAHVRAARQALAASQRGLEVGHWRQARDCFDHCGDTERAFDADCESVPSLIVVHGVTHAHSVIDRLIAQASSDEQRAAAWTARAMALLMAADHVAGVAAAGTASALAQHFESPWPRFEAARLQASGLAMGGRAVEALAIIEPFRELVERQGSAEHKGRFWADYAYVLNGARRLRDCAAATQRAIDNAQAMGELTELATLLSNLATVQGNLGHADEALKLARRAQALQVQLGSTAGPTGGVVEAYVGVYCGMAGRYGEALERLDLAIARFQSDGQTLWIAVASNHKAQLLLDLGQFARARQALVYEQPPIESVRARGAALAARVDRALGLADTEHLGQALAAFERGGDSHVRMHVMLDQALTSPPEAAIALCEEVLRIAASIEFVGVWMKAGLLRAQALHRAQRSAEAALQLRELLPRIDRVRPADMYLPEAWWIAVQVFDACGAGDEAVMALAQAARWIRQAALPLVPDEFRASFLQRNPTNLAVLAAADRRVLTAR